MRHVVNIASLVHRLGRQRLNLRSTGAQCRRNRRGFTLIEAAMTTVIIALGVLAMLELLAAGTMSNAAGNELTTAVNLANNVREISLGMAFYDPQNPTQWSTKESTVAAYDNVLDLDGCTFSPPLDVRRQAMSQYNGWAQVVKVQTVAEDQVNSIRPNTTAEPTARVTVTITHLGKSIYETNWLAVAPSVDQ